MKLSFITNYNDGLLKNFNLLNEFKLFQNDHSGSKFKWLYENIEFNDELKNEKISSVMVFDSELSIPIGVVLFFHINKSDEYYYNNKSYISIGEIGIYVSPNYRGIGIAKKLLVEFENNFIDLYANLHDYAVVTTFGAAYECANKSFNWFVANNKPHSEVDILLNIKNAIDLKKIRNLKYYLYKKRNSKNFKS